MRVHFESRWDYKEERVRIGERHGDGDGTRVFPELHLSPPRRLVWCCKDVLNMLCYGVLSYRRERERMMSFILASLATYLYSCLYSGRHTRSSGKISEPFKFSVNRHFAWIVISWAPSADVYCKLRHVSISKDSWFFVPLQLFDPESLLYSPNSWPFQRPMYLPQPCPVPAKLFCFRVYFVHLLTMYWICYVICGNVVMTCEDKVHSIFWPMFRNFFGRTFYEGITCHSWFSSDVSKTT